MRYHKFIILLFVLLLASCGEVKLPAEIKQPLEEVVQEISAESDPAADELAATEEVPPVAVRKPDQKGGVAVIATADEISGFNPLLSNDPSSLRVISLIYSSMFKRDTHTGIFVCDLCETWQMSGDTISLTIQSGAEWSDSESITVDDFIYTYAALMWAEASGGLNTPQLEMVAPIESMEKIDDYQVVVELRDSDCTSLQVLTLPWLPRHIYCPHCEDELDTLLTREILLDSVDDTAFTGIPSNESNEAPRVASGPFQYYDWVPGDHVTLHRNPRYWQGESYLDGLLIRFAPDLAEQSRLIRTGEVDLIENIPAESLSRVELANNASVKQVPDDSYYYLAFQLGDPENPQSRFFENEATGVQVLNDEHGDHPILSDLRVRQAIALGIDKNAIISEAEAGQGIPMTGNMIPSIQWAYNQDLEVLGPDLETADQLLNAAGWQLDSDTGLRQRDGQELALTLVVNESSEKRTRIARLIAEQLGVIGINVNLSALEWGPFTGKLLGQEFDLAVMSWTDISLGMEDFDRHIFHSSSDVPLLGHNFVSYHNVELEEKWETASTIDGCRWADRAVLYQQVQRMLYDDLPYVWLYSPLRSVGISDRLIGVDPGSWGIDSNIMQWSLDNN